MANDDGLIEDESAGGGKRDDPEVLWVAPAILKPMPGRVYQGFDIDALIVIPGALSWNIDIHIGPTRLKRFSGWPLGGVGIFLTVPAGLIPPGAGFYFKIEYKMPIGWSAWAWSGDMEMAALPKPAITGVTVSADRRPTIRGTGGVEGAVLEIWYSGGGGGVQLSQTLDSNGAWSITASSPWPIKEHIITAKQNKYGDSGWADAYTFTVRPPTPVIGGVTVSVDLKPTISGTGGIKGAVLEIFNSGAIGGVQLSKTLASDGAWSIAASSPWPVKKHSISARQILGSHSGWAKEYEFTVSPPAKPVIGGVTVSVDLKPTISGTGGISGALLQIFNTGGSGGVQLSKTLATNGAWSITASAPWSVKKHSITAKQNLGSDSGWADAYEFTVRPPAPVIGAVTVSVDLKPTISGTGGIKGAVLEIFNSGAIGGVQLSKTLASDGAWSIAASSPWPVKKHSISARQTLGSHSGWAKEYEFTVSPPAKPVIGGVTVSVDLKPTISGTGGISGALLQIFNTGGSGGVQLSKTLATNGAWSITASAPWPVKKHSITAKQNLGSDSGWADDYEFTVRPATPTITEPPPKTSHLGNVLVKGACMTGATVVVQDSNGNPIGGTLSYSATTWSFAYTWPPGAKHIKAMQTVNGQTSAATDLLEFYINPPLPTITEPLPKTSHLGNVLVKGACMTGATVVVQDSNGNPIGGTLSYSATTWSFAYTWPPGAKHIKAMQTVNGQTSAATDLLEFYITPPLPTITEPLPKTSHLGNVLVKGACMTGATVVVQDSNGNPIAGTLSYSATTWSFAYTWPPGAKHIKAVQTVDGQTSAATDLLEFYVKPSKPAIQPLPNPAAADEALTITDVFSTGAVTLHVSNEAGAVEGEFSGSGATRTFTPTAEWAPGSNTVKVVQTVNAIDSDPSIECTFFVEVGERPDAPRFEQPMAGGSTPTRPIIRIAGLPNATVTVRLEAGETLHSDTADAEGVLEFKVDKPLHPGTNALQVKQKAGGPESEWSEPHLLAVRALPKKPVVSAPTPNSLVPRRVVIRGQGETRGEIVLYHAKDLATPIATVEGRASWRWDEEMWPIGFYTVQVRQTDEGDVSEYSEPRDFEIVDALYGIADAIPVLGNPVVGSGQSVMLRIQLFLGDTGEVAEGVKVVWRMKGVSDALATTVTDAYGWASYAYQPETVGESVVVADITDANAGVTMTQTYPVTALLQDDWAEQAILYLDGKTVDLAKSDLVLVAGKPYQLLFSVKPANDLWGSYLTLQDLWGATERGLISDPELGTPQKIEAQYTSWTISSAPNQSGIFGLRLTSPVLSDLQLPGRLIPGDYDQFVDVDLDTFPQVFSGEAAYPCLGATHTISMRPKPNSPLLGQSVKLMLSREGTDLGVTVSPHWDQKMEEKGVSWTLDCANSGQAGNFAVWLDSWMWDYKSPDIPMSLGHNKVEITERDGPREIAGRWRYGVRVASAFSGQPAGDIPVTVTVSSSGDVQRRTQSDGWLYVYYDDGQVVSLTIRNGYDGSTITD